MMLTSRGRYAVMAMVDLAQHADAGPVTLADIAARQDITAPYLEQIFSLLRAGGMVKSVRGPGGGYLLAMAPEEMTVADIIQAVDEPIKMTRCDHNPKRGCMSTKARCLTHDLWDGLGNHIHGYLKSVTLADVCGRRIHVEPLFIGGKAAINMQAMN